MKKIKKNLGQQKNGLPQQNYETDKDLVASTGASYIVKVILIRYLYLLFCMFSQKLLFWEEVCPG